MGKRNLKNLANLGSWSKYKKLSTYRKSKKENKENVRNHVRGDIQSDSTYRIPLNWIPSLLLWVPRVKERGSTNQSVQHSAGSLLQGGTHLKSNLPLHQILPPHISLPKRKGKESINHLAQPSVRRHQQGQTHLQLHGSHHLAHCHHRGDRCLAVYRGEGQWP